jgi:hypothetical protein
MILDNAMTSEMRPIKVEGYRCSHGFGDDFFLDPTDTPMLMIPSRASNSRII